MGAGEPKPGSGQGMQLPDIIKNKRGLVRKNERRNGERTKPGDGKEGKLVRVSERKEGLQDGSEEKETHKLY
jgi:hypothetical protein